MKNDVLICLMPAISIQRKELQIAFFHSDLLRCSAVAWQGVRWDSDRVIILNDDLSIAQEIKRCNALDRVSSAWISLMPVHRLTACYWNPQCMKAMLIAL